MRRILAILCLVLFVGSQAAGQTIHSRAELESAIDTTLASGQRITAAQLRSVLHDIVDSVELAHMGNLGSHTRYFGWSTDRTIATADFSTANTSTNNNGTLPSAAQNGYVWFAVPSSVGYPTGLLWAGGTRSQLAHFERLTGTVDDTGGEAHIIGITFNIQASTSLSGQPIELVY